MSVFYRTCITVGRYSSRVSEEGLAKSQARSRARQMSQKASKRPTMPVRSGEQRFYEGVSGFRFPMFFSVVADVSCTTMMRGVFGSAYTSRISGGGRCSDIQGAFR